jgi:biotin carboxyl carrier protein
MSTTSSSSAYKAIINKRSLDIAETEDGYTVNGAALQPDILPMGDGHFHILLENKSYRAEVVKADAATKTFTFKINNKPYTVEVKDKFDLLLEKMGMSSAAAGKINSLRAPMPGLIIDLKVKQGDTVKLNDPLLILEAMKMENILKSPGEGIVKTLKIKKGDSVEKNQVLIEFQD